MKTRTYLVVCAVVSVGWVAALLLVPPFAQTVEQLMLGFLSSNA